MSRTHYHCPKCGATWMDGYEDKACTCATNGWIDVRERLPEDRRLVLVWEGSESVIPGVEIAARYDGIWRTRTHATGLVTHWQPLPEGPE